MNTIEKEIELCRKAYEEYVGQCTKVDVQPIRLKTGYSGWIDFKAGWFAAKDRQ